MSHPPVGCRHPTQLYEMAKNWLIAGFIVWQTRQFKPRPGVVTWTFIGLYGLIRFFLMFIREEKRVWGPFTESQIFAGIMAILGAVMLVVISRGPTRK
jgi:prolipoprotein diacylglyceryltransferase